MDQYHLRMTAKTRFLNFFRGIFTIPAIEKFLLQKNLKYHSPFFQKLIPPNYLYKKPSIRKVARNGIFYKLDVSDVIDHYLYWGYKDHGYNTILEELKNANVILDIGANIGDTALFYASVNQKAEIFAFEPHPSTFKKSAENVELNNFSNIHLINLGLGDKPGTFKLYEVNENNTGMNRIISENKKLPYQEVTIETLDNIVSEKGISNVDFIKLDVEGFEHAVLLGGKNIITQSKPVLFIELDDNNLTGNNSSAKQVVQTLQSYGYKKIYRADNLSPLTAEQDFKNCHYDIIARC